MPLTRTTRNLNGNDSNGDKPTNGTTDQMLDFNSTGDPTPIHNKTEHGIHLAAINFFYIESKPWGLGGNLSNYQIINFVFGLQQKVEISMSNLLPK